MDATSLTLAATFHSKFPESTDQHSWSTDKPNPVSAAFVMQLKDRQAAADGDEAAIEDAMEVDKCTQERGGRTGGGCNGGGRGQVSFQDDDTERTISMAIIEYYYADAPASSRRRQRQGHRSRRAKRPCWLVGRGAYGVRARKRWTLTPWASTGFTYDASVAHPYVLETTKKVTS
jgi:hypothetical protein